MAEIVNGTCHAKKAPDGPPLIQHGNLVFQGEHILACFPCNNLTCYILWKAHHVRESFDNLLIVRASPFGRRLDGLSPAPLRSFQ